MQYPCCRSIIKHTPYPSLWTTRHSYEYRIVGIGHSHEYRIVGADNKRPLLLSFCCITFTNSIYGKTLKYAGKVLRLSLTTQEETDGPCTLEKKVFVYKLEEYHLFNAENSINAPANNKELYLNILFNLRRRKLSLPQTHYTFLTDLKNNIYCLFVEGKASASGMEPCVYYPICAVCLHLCLVKPTFSL